MKYWVSCLLMILFSLQQLPVKELGKLLVKKTSTEQVEDGDGSGTDEDNPSPLKQLKEKEDPLKYCMSTVSFQFKEVIVTHQVATALHKAHRLVPHFVPDIATPPPNYG